MGNRGGRIHNPETKTLTRRRWVSKRWITCATRFKHRQRIVMGQGYTELFFFDEVSALAAGHRPCFECRRKDADSFSRLWKNATGLANSASDMDQVLHRQRLTAGMRLNENEIATLPEGTMFKSGDEIMTFKNGLCIAWSGLGYIQTDWNGQRATLITPPAIVDVLREGYRPVWHETASR